MELTVISGKGGTGKTTIAMAISDLNEETNMADCDVDASNLYLYYNGKDIKKQFFYALKKAVINEKFCTNCKKCETVCKFDAIKDCKVNMFKCEGCAACTLVCPENAIDMRKEKAADAYITQLDSGHITRAQMEIGSDGSGKLVTLLRKNARKFCADDSLIIIDGSPGIGCPVISSITASDIVLLVTEPTLSGFKDFKRVALLCDHFGILTLACINKHDINIDISKDIENYCRDKNIDIVGVIPYDGTVTKSINELKPITDYPQSPANKSVRVMWEKIKKYVDNITKKNEENEDYYS